jgi:hypothetical protein
MALCNEIRDAAARPHQVKPSGQGCAECLREGSTWVHLRLCLACGHVGCCDSSPGRHARAHFHATEHPVVRSFEPGETWAWCWLHGQMVEDMPAFEGEMAAEHYAAP